MDTLANRAERAVLGAMIASPELCGRVRSVVRPGDFRDPWHQRVYQAIASASRHGPRDPAGFREAVLAADPLLIWVDLDQLAEGCPDPGHGLAYAEMLVLGESHRSLAERGRELGALGRKLSRDADVIRRIGDAGADALAVDAGHFTSLGDALRAHAATMVPGTTSASAPVLRYPVTEPARREELVLAALANLKPGDAHEILQAVGPSAITDPYRREVFEVLSGMTRNGRPVDELTLDWAIAERGLPLQPKDGGATIGERLARVRVTFPEALTAARKLQDQAGRAVAAGPQPPGQAGSRRVTRARTQDPPAGSQLAPILKLHRNGPGTDGPDHGPRPR